MDRRITVCALVDVLVSDDRSHPEQDAEQVVRDTLELAQLPSDDWDNRFVIIPSGQRMTVNAVGASD